jgi:CheY-like chemotaxis protein/two-component sensor histidine kinase
VQSQERLRALTAELTLTEQRERKRLATDLHDYLAQLLVVMRMKLRQAVPLVPAEKAIRLLKEADQALTQALDYTRSLVAQLAPPTLNEFGLLQSVEWLASQMQQQHGLTVNVHPAADGLSLPEDQAILLFQSVRELLYNVLKHARTDEATVKLAITPDSELQISVEDRGCGLDASTLDVHGVGSTRFGLFSLKERMATMGGRISIDSRIGTGTRVALLLPYWPARSGPECETGGSQAQQATYVPRREEPTADPSHSTRGVSDRPLPEARRIRVLLVDDHAMVRQGLRSVLESYDDIEVVGEAADGKQSLDWVERLRPSVVTILKSRYPDILILGLSVNAGTDNQKAMLKAGASALLTKEAAVDQLYGMIHDSVAERRS